MIGFRCPKHRQLDSDLVVYIHLMNIRLLDNEIGCSKIQQQRIDNRPPRASQQPWNEGGEEKVCLLKVGN